MSYQPVYEPAAFVEYKEAIAWYKGHSETAAKNFVIAVKTRLQEICEHPTRYRNLYKNFREASLSKFPYSIVFFVDDLNKIVVVSSVYHHKRNPKKKYNK